MPFYKLKQHATPGICEPRLVDQAERELMQNQIANYVRKFAEEKLDKKPDGIRVTIVDDMIIILFERYLTRLEKYIIENEPTGAETIRAMRIDVVTGIINEGGLTSYVENLVGAKAIYSLYDSYPQDEYCVWLFMFDKKLT